MQPCVSSMPSVPLYPIPMIIAWWSQRDQMLIVLLLHCTRLFYFIRLPFYLRWMVMNEKENFQLPSEWAGVVKNQFALKKKVRKKKSGRQNSSRSFIVEHLLATLMSSDARPNRLKFRPVPRAITSHHAQLIASELSDRNMADVRWWLMVCRPSLHKFFMGRLKTLV